MAFIISAVVGQYQYNHEQELAAMAMMIMRGTNEVSAAARRYQDNHNQQQHTDVPEGNNRKESHKPAATSSRRGYSNRWLYQPQQLAVVTIKQQSEKLDSAIAAMQQQLERHYK